jgi:hypothetical protein
MARFGTGLWRKAMVLAVALLTLGASMTASVGDAEAKRGRNAAIIAGVIGGIALGAAIANSHPRYAYEDGYYHRPRKRVRYVRQPRYKGDYYIRTRPRYVEDYHVHRPRCRVRTVIAYDDFGDAYRKRIRVCR